MVTRDRTIELITIRQHSYHGVEKGWYRQNSIGNKISSIHKVVDDVQHDMIQLTQFVDAARRLHHELLTSVTHDRKLADNLDAIRLQIDRISENIRVQLNYLRTPSMLPGRKLSTDGRIRVNHYISLSSRYQLIMEAYECSENDYLNRLRKRLFRQLSLGKVTGSTDHVNDVIVENTLSKYHQKYLYNKLQDSTSNDMTSDDMTQQQLEALHAGIDLQNMLEDERDIKQLENKIHKVNELFQDLREYVHEQSHTVDSIAMHVMRTESYVDEAVRDFRQAKIYDRGRNKKYLHGCAALCVLIILGVIGVAGYLLGRYVFKRLYWS